MSGLFVHILNISFVTSFLIIACIVVRALFKRMPKHMRVLLWLLVAVRLIVPFSIESSFSLLPFRSLVRLETSSADVSEIEIFSTEAGDLSTSRPQVSVAGSNVDVDKASAPESAPLLTKSNEKDNLFCLKYTDMLDVLSLIWIAGVIAFIIYGFVMYIRLVRCVSDAVKVSDRVYQTEHIVSPFVLGFIRPRIYLPYNLTTAERFFVMKHEKAHIARLDHLIKPAAFLLASIYWFNPFVWVAYILLCRDIEYACDEKVIAKIGYNKKKEYSQSILNLSMPRRYISACPVAFGETGVKERVRNVLNMKKTKKIIIVVAALVLAAVGIGFLTYPKIKNDDSKEVSSEALAEEITEVTTEEIAEATTEEITEATEEQIAEGTTEAAKETTEAADSTSGTEAEIEAEAVEVAKIVNDNEYLYLCDDCLEEGAEITLTLQDGKKVVVNDAEINLDGDEVTLDDDSIKELGLVIYVSSDGTNHTVKLVTDSSYIWPIEDEASLVCRTFSEDHSGVDIASPEGTEVVASTGGTVSEIGEDDGVQFLKIKTNDGKELIYKYIQVSNDLTVNSEVFWGQVVGTIDGAEGTASTGPHLHIEITDADGKLVDPLTILPEE